ncbi:tyrosine-type recombinase/integrase [Sulfurimonas sp.]|uniref:tyrosine-type recombinase/integrase n=1 Tax=Sulfurimonas sp. TaxID=2022749 RepID=UPI003D0C1E7C
MRGSIDYQVSHIWAQVDGIGISKAATRAQSDLKAMNGHNMSDLVHSFKSKDEFVRIAKELGKFAKNNFKIKDLQAINTEVVTAYIHDKIEDGLYRKSISSYISVLQKIQVGLSKMEQKKEAHKSLYTQQDLKNLRLKVDQEAVSKEHLNRAYNNPAAFTSDMVGKSRIGFELQLQYGVRVSEAILIRPSQLLKNNVLKVQGKGGYIRKIAITKELYKAIEKEVFLHGSYNQTYNNYIKDLKNAVEKQGEKWNSTHGLRYNYAQRRMEELTPKIGYEKALQKVSFELGHHRTEITKHYLK